MSGDWWRGLHRLADPKITLASAASMTIGAAAAARDGPLAVGWLLLTIAGIFAIETAKNASGELVDFASGADANVRPEERSPFSGGKRVLVDGLLTRAETASIAATAYAIGIAAGLAIVLAREPRVLAFGFLGVALAWFYHASPLRLSYRGLGELAVAVVYGPVIACGTYLVQRGRVGSDVLLASAPLGLLIAAFLWINEFPDCRADGEAGKRTLVVRLGRRAASRVFGWIVAAAYGGLVLLVAFGAPSGLLFGLAGLPHAAAAARRLLADPETTSRIVPAQVWTLRSFLLYAAGAGAGLLLAGAGRAAGVAP
ncbi:MAG: prenyltransferase [Hyphomicrobiales bacterium]